MEKGFLHLKTAEDLFKKLEYDYEALKEDVHNPYKAFNFFVTAEHLPDWVGDTSIKDKNPFLRISSHLATGAKHFNVTNPKKNSVDSTAVDIYVEEGYVDDGYIEAILSIILTEKESKELGINSIPVMGLTEEVLSFWKEYFEN